MLGRGELNLTPSLKTSSPAQIPILMGCPQTLSTVPMNSRMAANGFSPCLGVPLSCWTLQTTATSYNCQLPPPNWSSPYVPFIDTSGMRLSP